MSDSNKITASRQAAREATSGAEWRKVAAAEQAADALEGIRQDLTLISGQLTQVVQALSSLANTVTQLRR